MKWKWCEMCRFDGHCENQDRNMECACYAREQTLRAEQYANLIDKQQKQLEIAVGGLERVCNISNNQEKGVQSLVNQIVSCWLASHSALKQIKELEK